MTLKPTRQGLRKYFINAKENSDVMDSTIISENKKF